VLEIAFFFFELLFPELIERMLVFALPLLLLALAYASIRQRTSAYVSIRQDTWWRRSESSSSVSIR
jgi:hypothetical protein